MKIGIWLLKYGFLFWLIETIVFLIEHGWHYFPINKAELTCDIISSVMMSLGFGIIVYHFIKLFKETE
jgi:hypothetical protein